MRRGSVSGGHQTGGQGCFIGRFSVGSTNLKKFQTSWLAKRCLVLLFRRPTSLYISTVYVNTRPNMHAVSVCFRNPSNYDTDHRIFHVPTQSFNACIYTSVCLYSVRLRGCLSSWRGRRLGPPPPFFFHLGGPLGPLLRNPRSNTDPRGAVRYLKL